MSKKNDALKEDEAIFTVKIDANGKASVLPNWDTPQDAINSGKGLAETLAKYIYLPSQGPSDTASTEELNSFIDSCYSTFHQLVRNAGSELDEYLEPQMKQVMKMNQQEHRTDNARKRETSK